MHIQDHPLSSTRVRRQYAGISSSQMADRLGVKRTSYLRFERGERRAFLDQAYAIASMLGCTVLDLARLPSPDEVKVLYARANTTLGEPAGAQPEPEPNQPTGTVVDAHDDTRGTPTGTANNDVAAMIETWDDD